MSALDQAFIRAYVWQGVAPTVSGLDSARPQVDASAQPAARAAAEATGEVARRSSGKTTTRVPKRPRSESSRRASAQSSRKRARGHSPAAARRGDRDRKAVAPSASGRAPVKADAGASNGRAGKTEPSASAAGVRSVPCAGVSAETLFVGAAPAEASASGGEPASAKPVACQRFRPMLEVDRFAWPAVVSRLDTGVGGPLEPLIEALTRGVRQGWKAIAVAGCQRGDGCTTVAMAAARQLARQGLRVVLADADFQDPRLSKRLGLAPQSGWEEVLGGRLPLGEVAIESVLDRLVLLPVCRPLTGIEKGVRTIFQEESPMATSPNCRENSSDPFFDAAAALGVLRERYDLILLDLGRLYKRSKTAIGPFDSAGGWIDAAVLVHNVRATSQTELAQAHERLRAAGIAEVLTVENFV
jgi:Mrp family chromosome partitioning ATPase